MSFSSVTESINEQPNNETIPHEWHGSVAPNAMVKQLPLLLLNVQVLDLNLMSQKGKHDYESYS